MTRIDDLMSSAFSAVPATGEISVPVLVQNLKSSGNGDAVPLLAELKKRGLIASKLEFNDGVMTHTYRRVEGASL